MRWRVYVLECTARSGRVTVHVGIARDVYARVAQHAAGKVRATRGRSVVLLGHSAPMEQGDALRMEARLKRLPPDRKRQVVARWQAHG